MTHHQLQSLPTEIAQPLKQLDRKVRWLAVMRGVSLLITLLIVGVGVGLLLDLWLGLGETARLALLATLGVAALAAAGFGILKPLLARTSPAEMAALIEAAHPELNERLTSTVELLRSDDPESYKGSPLMRQLLLQETTETVRGADLGDAVDGVRAQRWGWAAVVAMFLTVLPLFYSRDGYLLLLTRFFNPRSNLEQVSNLFFVVDQGDRTVARGTDVTILAEPQWRVGEATLPDEVWLNWTNTGGEADQRRMLWDPDQKLFTATLPHVFQAFDFRVEAGPARTREYHVNVVEAPIVTAVVVDIQPPAYTGLPAQRVDGAVGETTVFERSHVRLEVQFNKPMATAAVRWLGAPASNVGGPAASVPTAPDSAPANETSLILSPDRQSGAFEFDAIPEYSGRFALHVTDEYALENGGEPSRSLRLQLDQPPTVAFADQLDNPEARPNDVITLPATAADDIAVHELELHYSVVPQGGRNVVAAEGQLLGIKQVDTPFRLDLAKLTTDLGVELKLQDNDRLRLRLRAADERPIPGPNEAWSEERTITIREDAAPYGFEAIAQTREQWRQILQSIREELELNRRQVRDLAQEATDDAAQQTPFDQNEAIPPLAAHEREQSTRLEQLAALLETSPLFGNLTAPLEAVAHEELAQAPAALETAQQAAVAQKPDALNSAVTQLDSAIQKLTALEQGFEKIAELERDLSEIQRLAERAQQLAEDAVALDQERNDPRADLPPERQQSRNAALEMERQQLTAEHQNLQEDLTDLLDRRPEILDAAREQQFDKLRELARQALELAKPQEELAEQFTNEAQAAAQDLQALALKQQELLAKGQQLAGAVEPNQARQLVQPLDLDELRRALEPLQQGNVEDAAQRQEQAASELERLAAELQKNELLPADPQAAAQELARREGELQKEIETASESHRQARETLKQQPSDADAKNRLQATEQELRDLGAAQTAIQSAVANLDVPRNDTERQQGTVRRAFETVQQLLDDKPEQAVKTADSTRQSLEALANEIGDADRRTRDAQNDARRLREQQEQIAREAAEIAKRANEGQAGDQTQQQLEQLQQREQQLARELAELDVPAAAQPRKSSALQEAAAAARDVAARQPTEAAASSREAAQALADLEQQLQDRPTAGEVLAEMLPREQQVTKQLNNTDSPPQGDQLKAGAKDQRELSQQLAKLPAPLSEQARDEARRQLDEAARAADEAAGGDAEKLANARRENTEAQAALESLQQQVAGRPNATESPESQQAAQSQLAQAFNPEAEALTQLSQQAEQMAGRQADLRRQTAELAGQQAEAAVNEAAAAAQTPAPNQSKEQREQAEQQRRQQEQQNRERRQQLDQRANELRQQQEQLTNEIRKLPPQATANAAAEARESSDEAREALGNRDAAQAAADQQQAENALRDLAAAAQGQMESQQQTAAQSAQQAMQATPNAEPETAAAGPTSPSEQLAQRASELAAEHRQLADAIRNARAQRLAQNTPPQSPAATPTTPPSEAGPTESAAPVAESGMTPAEQTEAAIAAQQQLAHEAAQVALRTAEQTGPESDATAAALQFAEQTSEAARAAAAGQLPQAAQGAEQARSSAAQATDELRAAGPETPEAMLADRASELAQLQQSLAQQLQQLAQSPAARSAAQSQAQERMAAQAENLADQFASVAENLAAQPLDRPQQGQQAGEARQSSQQASEQIGQSAGNLSAGNPQQAAAQAQQGAQDLRQAAEQALRAAGQSPAQPSQVPQSVGQQLAQAMQQLDAAGDQLAQMPAAGQPGQSPQQANAGQQPGQMQPGDQASAQPMGEAPMTADAGQPTEGSPTEPSSGQGQPGEQVAGMGEPTGAEGQPTGAEGQASGMPQPSASNNLQQVAQSLNQAAEQLGLTPGQAQGQRAQNQPASTAGAPTMEGESSDTGAQETVRLTDLDVQLQNISSRNWGELPGKLQTEILQSSQNRTKGDYGQVIQRYFEEVSRSRTTPATAK